MKPEAAAQIVLGLAFHAPWCYAGLLLFDAHPALAVYLVSVSSLLAARSLADAFQKLKTEAPQGESDGG